MQLCHNILLTIINVLVLITQYLIYQQVLNSHRTELSEIKWIPSSIFSKNN